MAAEGPDHVRLLLSAAILSCAAALIHAAVTPSHFEEYWGFGAFFVVVAILQLGWAELLRRGDPDRRILILGAVGNLAVALIWLISRTAGLPFGPGAGQAEGVGFQDVLATLDEIGIALLVAAVLLPAMKRPSQAILTGAWILAALSIVAAFLGGHSH
ncbi:MAG: hypothetical protein ACXWZM_02105 [Solirubrobacterales bacterium]